MPSPVENFSPSDSKPQSKTDLNNLHNTKRSWVPALTFPSRRRTTAVCRQTSQEVCGSLRGSEWEHSLLLALQTIWHTKQRFSLWKRNLYDGRGQLQECRTMTSLHSGRQRRGCRETDHFPHTTSALSNTPTAAMLIADRSGRVLAILVQKMVVREPNHRRALNKEG